MELEHDDLVVQTQARIAQASTLEDLQRTLLTVAPLFHRALRRRTLRGLRPDLRLRVASLKGNYSGLAVPGPRQTQVFLNNAESSTRRRYTLAHELGHALLARANRDDIPLDRVAEETMCQRFAQEVLMPSAELRHYFSTVGFPQSASSLQEFCRHFLVGIGAAVRALSAHHAPDRPVALVAASRRAHSLRSAEVTLRVDAASTPASMLAPHGKRLRSLGLTRLLVWMAQVSGPGVQACAEEQRVLLRSLQVGVSGWTGPARWTALTVNGPGTSEPDALGVVVLLDVARLRALPMAGRAQSRREPRQAAAQTDPKQRRLPI